MNREMGLSTRLRRLTAPVCVMIRGELAIGRIFAPRTSHEGGTVKGRHLPTRVPLSNPWLEPVCWLRL